MKLPVMKDDSIGGGRVEGAIVALRLRCSKEELFELFNVSMVAVPGENRTHVSWNISIELWLSRIRRAGLVLGGIQRTYSIVTACTTAYAGLTIVAVLHGCIQKPGR